MASDDDEGVQDFQGGGTKKKAPSAAKLALHILDQEHLLTDAGGTVYRYVNGAWQPLPEQWVLSRALKAEWQDFESAGSTGNKRNEVLKFIKAQTFDPDLKWGRVQDFEVPVLNGIVDVLTGDLNDHNPNHRLERVVPLHYDPRAECPTWDQVLIDWFGDGDLQGGEVDALQQFFGYIVLAHAKYKKAMLLHGPGDTGKSIIPDVAKALVGEQYTCRLSVEHMDDPTRLSVIKGKALNIMTELPTGAMIADGGFKAIVSTEEPVFIDPKYHDPEMYTPSVKVVIATNTLPRINDQSEATFNRLLIIPMTTIIPQASQDRRLAQKLRQELPGILNWAIAGAKTLVQNGGQWPHVPAADRLVRQYKDDLNPIRQFMAERMFRKVGEATPLALITDAYNKWNRGGRTEGVKQVGNRLRSAGYGGDIKKVRHKEQVLSSLIGFVVSDYVPEKVDVSDPRSIVPDDDDLDDGINDDVAGGVGDGDPRPEPPPVDDTIPVDP